MKNILAVIFVALFSMSTVAQASDLSDRRAEMKSLNGYLKILNGQKTSYDASIVATEAGNVVQSFEKLQTLFAEKGEGETRARDAVWSDPDGFSEALADALAAAKNLQSNGENNDQSAFADAFGQLGQACGGCHRNYRARR